MGDRSNIVIAENGHTTVIFYGHWLGEGYVEIVQEAIKRAKDPRINGNVDRTRDTSYFSAIVARVLLKPDINGALGYGISNSILDNEYPLLVVDCGKGLVYFIDEKNYNTDGFVLPTLAIDPPMSMEVFLDYTL